MTAVAFVALAVLVVAATLCLVRLVRSETLVDRALALDTVAAIVVSAIAVRATWRRDGVFVDVALVLGLLGFLATVTIARYVGRRGS